MTDISPEQARALVPLDISEVSPATVTANSLLKGLITIKWPYSSSGQKLTFLLADADIRRRASGGQVKITLLGEAAEVLDQMESGEEISIASSNADSVTVETITEPRLKWHITFPNGCILQLKDQPARHYAPPAPTKPIIAIPLPRVPTPPLAEEPYSQKGVWKTPIKRKFGELTDHSVTSSLTEEEEWFGSEPKSGSQDVSRRFSGRMRFIGLDSPNMSSSPQIRRITDENSISRTPPRPQLPRKSEISPAVVLEAQNLVSAEILSEKLLHPPRAVGTGMDDLSHVAIEEGSLRPMSVGIGSNTGKKSFGERSFDVFVDEEKDVDGAEASVMEDVLPAELTRPTQVGQWSVPAPPLSVSERQSPQLHAAESGSEVPESENSESEMDEERLPDVTRPDRQSLQLTDTPPVVSEVSSREHSDDDLDVYDASGQLIQPSRRRYYQPDQQPSSEEEFSGSDDVDYEHPERYQDDEELSAQEFDEQDTLQHAGHYSQGRRIEYDSEFDHSGDEEYSDEEEESEDDEPVSEKAPVFVDLTLDSSEDEQSEEDEEDDRLELRGYTDDEPESEEEGMEEEEEKEEEEEEEEEEYESEQEWTGIETQTPATAFTDHPQQPQELPPSHGMDIFLDPSLTAPLPTRTQDTQSHSFGFDPALQIQSEAIAQQHAPNFPPDLIAQALDPAIFQQPHTYDTHQLLTSIGTPTATIMDTVLAFAQEQAAMDNNYSAEVPRIDAHTMQDLQHRPMLLSEIMEAEEAIFHKHVDNVDSTAQQEFLMGIMPMGNQERGDEATADMQWRLTQEFLPSIVPDVTADVEDETRVDEEVERKVRQEPEMLGTIEIIEKWTEERITIDMEATEESREEIDAQTPVISAERLTTTVEEVDVVVEEETVEVLEKAPESLSIDTTTAIVEQMVDEEPIIVAAPPPQPREESFPEQENPAPTRRRSPSPPSLPDDWRAEGLTTPLAYFPPLADIFPPGLRAQKENRRIDVIGIIRTSGELSKTKGVDYLLPLHVVDPSTGTESGLSVQLFRPHKSALPENPEIGSVIVLTDMKVQSHQHRAQVRTTDSSGWILFPVSGEVVDSGPPVEYGEEEELMVKQLQHWWKRSLAKGKGKQKSEMNEKNGVDGHVKVNGDDGNTKASGKGTATGKDGKNWARRSGRRVNINRE